MSNNKEINIKYYKSRNDELQMFITKRHFKFRYIHTSNRILHGPTEGIVTRNGSRRLTIVDTAGRSRNFIPGPRDTRASVTYHIYLHPIRILILRKNDDQILFIIRNLAELELICFIDLCLNTSNNRSLL